MKRLLTCSLLIASFFIQAYSQTNWIKHSENPVMEPDQDWETRVIGPNAVIYDNDMYHMWYTAGEFPGLGGDLFIGYAVSADGLNWIKDEGNPVFVDGEDETWDSRGVYKSSVFKIGSTYHMWYNGYASSGSPKEIGHATSDDGITWTRDQANPVLSAGTSGEWDHTRLANPTVVYDGSLYHMWYGGFNGDGSVVELGHATSVDGTNWTKDPQNPVISHDAESWDNPQLDYPFAIYKDSTFHIWYNAGSFLGWDLGYATSQDGTIWTKHNDPVLTKGAAGTWDSRYISMPVILYDEALQKYKIWYRSESADNTNGGIGFAEQMSTAIDGSPERKMPIEFSISQNYPNPFNPSTTIEFSIPKSEFVSLKVYNLLGQDVQTLVSKKLDAGVYKYNWNASGFASGIYIYTIETKSGFKKSMKLVLLR